MVRYGDKKIGGNDIKTPLTLAISRSEDVAPMVS